VIADCIQVMHASLVIVSSAVLVLRTKLMNLPLVSAEPWNPP
jgi:hypothetical protein